MYSPSYFNQTSGLRGYLRGYWFLHTPYYVSGPFRPRSLPTDEPNFKTDTQSLTQDCQKNLGWWEFIVPKLQKKKWSLDTKIRYFPRFPMALCRQRVTLHLPSTNTCRVEERVYRSRQTVESYRFIGQVSRSLLSLTLIRFPLFFVSFWKKTQLLDPLQP